MRRPHLRGYAELRTMRSSRNSLRKRGPLCRAPHKQGNRRAVIPLGPPDRITRGFINLHLPSNTQAILPLRGCQAGRATMVRVTMTTTSRLLAWVCLCLLVGVGPAVAQDDAGSIWGIVTDKVGGLLPGVTVTAQHAATGLARSAVTSEDGDYEIVRLPAGDYEVSVFLPGFRADPTAARVEGAETVVDSFFDDTSTPAVHSRGS